VSDAVFIGALPDAVPLWAAALLVATSALTSFMTAAFGLGGGVAMLAVMASLVPAAALIPVHGVVQIGSNAGRAMVRARDVRFVYLAPFAVGSLLGAAAGGLVAVRLPDWLLQIGLGLFVLWSAWGKPPAFGGRRVLALGGAATSFFAMFVGASGPFVAAVVKTLRLERLEYVGTFAACMTLQHGLKIAVFGLLGFAFEPWLPLLAAMIASGFVGTLVGQRLLVRLGEARFQTILSAILTALALRLVWTGLAALAAS
jgi:uncharacterized membrane protein YfcA